MEKFFRDNLANALTCLNLSCGVAGIIQFSQHGLDALPTVQWLILIAGIADFFDGFVARLLKSQSKIGKDLDSLADAITFGVLPSVIAYGLLNHLVSTDDHLWALPYFGISIAIFSVIRLAIFNNDTRQTEGFIGVPTPANTLFLIFVANQLYQGTFFFPISLGLVLTIVAVSSWLLVSPIPLIALKFKSFSWQGNSFRFLLIGLSLVAILVFGELAVSIVFVLYLLLSIIQFYTTRHEIQSQR
jgi:CDP-diacylglycerol--serine O-phosphatidyltransferase